MRVSSTVAAQYVVTFLKPEMLHIYRQISAVRAFRPVVLCQKRENADQFPFNDVLVLPKPWSHQLRRFWHKTLLRRPITIYRSEAIRILAELRRWDAKLIHIYFGHIGVHLLPLLDLLAVRTDGAGSPFPSVVSFHGADADVNFQSASFQRAMERVFERTKLLLVRSESLGARLRSHGAPFEKIRVHRTGIPLKEISFHQRTAPSDGRWEFLQSSRLIPKKGLETTLRAFAQFSQQWPDAHLAIAGQGPELEKLRRCASELRISDRISFLGFLSQYELRQVERNSHIFLHPSERGSDGDQEGVPNSMLEAMASGLPTAATLHGGIPEAVEQNISGLLVKEGDFNALSQALLGLVANPERFAEMSKAAAQKVNAEFDLETQTRRLEQLYRDLVP